MENVTDFVEHRTLKNNQKAERAKAALEYGVSFIIYYPNGTVSNVKIPGLRIIHWRDENTGTWEVEVASLAIADDEDPGKVGMTLGFLDCLISVDLCLDSGRRYYLRKAFQSAFIEAVEVMGYPSVPQEALVSVEARRIKTAVFDHGTIMRQLEPTIVFTD